MPYMLAITVLLLATTTATAQSPAPFPIGQCRTTRVTQGPSGEKAPDVQPRKYQIPGFIFLVPANLCTQYTKSGWEKTMRLHLGEGAEKYRALIERAVEVWNATVLLPSYEPLIEIVETRPLNYFAPRLFSSASVEQASDLVFDNSFDGQSTIYFKPYGGRQPTTWGFALSNDWLGEMVESRHLYQHH